MTNPEPDDREQRMAAIETLPLAERAAEYSRWYEELAASFDNRLPIHSDETRARSE